MTGKIQPRKFLRGLMAAFAFALIGSVADAADLYPDGAPKRPDFDPKEHCKCVFTAIKRKQALREGYRALAESYKDTLQDLATKKGVPAKWVELRNLNSQQVQRFMLLNEKLNEEEKKMASQVADDDCGMPADVEIILETDSKTGALPSEQTQRAAKQHFPFEELFDAVMLHEAYHSAEFSKKNPRSGSEGFVPKLRTPYWRAMEEAAGYDVEIAELRKLEKKCKASFKDVKIIMRAGVPPDELVTTQVISGFACGDPHASNWTITVRTIMTGGGTVISETEDPPWESDCVEPGSQAALHYENVMKNSPKTYLGWYCLYSPGPPAQVTIRTPKLTMGMYGMEMKVDPPEDHTVDAKLEACEEERAPDKKEDAPPVPVS